MSDRIQEAFGLRRRPFGKDLPPEAMWLDETRQSAVDRLVDAVTARQHALVIGESGVGKTCVLRALRVKLSPVHFKLVYVSNVTLGKRDFYRQVSHALGIDAKFMPAAMFEAIQRNLHQLTAEHRQHPVLVLDEAQLIPNDTLAHLHVLANFDWDSQPMLSLVLVGLPEFADRLKLGIHRSLLTRISAKVEVHPTSADHTVTYVRQRLKDAGCKSEIFAPDGYALLHELTGGLLRSVDVLAEAALRLAAHTDVRIVDRALVRRAFQLTPLA